MSNKNKLSSMGNSYIQFYYHEKHTGIISTINEHAGRICNLLNVANKINAEEDSVQELC